MKNYLDIAVALLIFNRPEATQRLVDEVVRARPKRLFVIADGPRPSKPGEEEKCAAARAVIDRVDWGCEVLKNYSDVNLGVGIRPASGIQWVFEHADQAIILEDDCVPAQTFFRYCDELLEKYRDDERVMHISGDNWRWGERPFSYFFSCYCYSCGWATWRRAFQHYDPEVKIWPKLRETSWLMDILGDRQAVEFWAARFEEVHTGGIKQYGWDWPWLFACWAHSGLSILPSTNLISNIGFDEDATHTQKNDDERAYVPTVEMTFPLRHPPYMVRDTESDRKILEQFLFRPSSAGLYYRLRARVGAVLPPPVRKLITSLRSRTSRRTQS